MSHLTGVPSWARRHVDIWRSKQHLIGEKESRREPLASPGTKDEFLSSKVDGFRSLDDVPGIDRTPGKGSIQFIKPAAGQVQDVSYTGNSATGAFVANSLSFPGERVEFYSFSDQEASKLTLINNAVTGEVDGQVIVVDREFPARSWTNRTEGFRN